MVKNVGALVLGIVGGIVGVLTIIPAILFIWRVIIKPKFFSQKPQAYKKEGSYAIITGAAGGIGKAFTIRFAKEGYNVFIMDRAAEPLHALKQEIEEKYKVTVKESVCDFIQTDKEGKWDEIAKQFEGIDVAVLVNNVGMVQYLPGEFHSLELRDINFMVTLNIRTLLMMTHICIPKMLERNHRSLIINMSSSTSGYPHPMIQVYSSTKAFVRQFADSINAEYQGKIDVIAYTPWYVKTDMTKIRENAIYALTPESFVNYCFNYFGTCGHINPYWFHYLMDIGTSCIPSKIWGQQVYKQQSFVRKRFIMRKEAEEKKKAEESNEEKPKQN